MLSFLRKGRKQWLRENRISRYLAYAFGEIVLVVLGILIAVQINNWNETRKYRAQTNEILRNIVDDLTNDTTEVGIALRNYQDRKSVFKAVLEGKANSQ